MKKKYLGIILLFSNIGCVWGMDLAVELDIAQKKIPGILKKEKKIEYDMSPKIWPITQCCDILNMPIKDIRSSVERLSYSQQEKLRESLASSFTFALAMLPKELCLYILHKAYDEESDEQDNSKAFFSTPIIDAVTGYQELCNDPVIIGTKKISLSSYLTLSKEKKHTIRSIVNPSLLSRFFEGASQSVLSQENYETVIELVPADDESELIILPSYWRRCQLCCSGCMQKPQLGFGLTVTVMAAASIVQVPLVLGIVLEFKPAYILGGIIDVGIITACMLWGISECRNYVIREAQKNRAV